MSAPSSESRADGACRARYALLERQCRTQGLQQAEVERSKFQLTRVVHNAYFLKSEAYTPTGVALGCPLPDRNVSRRLWRLSRLVERRLAALCTDQQPTFAFVPPDSYHVTLVNKSHFDFTDIALLTQNERERVQTLIRQVCADPIVTDFRGFVLTAHGRLIACGYPKDDQLQRVRMSLVEAFPQLQVNLPSTAHIKLGHVLLRLEMPKLETLLKWVYLCGQHLSARITFRDVYTPAGRIALALR
jgi:hypothetical protein